MNRLFENKTWSTVVTFLVAAIAIFLFAAVVNIATPIKVFAADDTSSGGDIGDSSSDGGTAGGVNSSDSEGGTFGNDRASNPGDFVDMENNTEDNVTSSNSGGFNFGDFMEGLLGDYNNETVGSSRGGGFNPENNPEIGGGRGTSGGSLDFLGGSGDWDNSSSGSRGSSGGTSGGGTSGGGFNPENNPEIGGGRGTFGGSSGGGFNPENNPEIGGGRWGGWGGGTSEGNNSDWGNGGWGGWGGGNGPECSWWDLFCNSKSRYSQSNYYSQSSYKNNYGEGTYSTGGGSTGPGRGPVCDYAQPPRGCTLIKGVNYNPQTNCGLELACTGGGGSSGGNGNGSGGGFSRCQTYYEGYVYEGHNSCVKQGASGCSNPFQYQTLEQCARNNYVDEPPTYGQDVYYPIDRALLPTCSYEPVKRDYDALRFLPELQKSYDQEDAWRKEAYDKCLKEQKRGGGRWWWPFGASVFQSLGSLESNAINDMVLRSFRK